MNLRTLQGFGGWRLAFLVFLGLLQTQLLAQSQDYNKQVNRTEQVEQIIIAGSRLTLDTLDSAGFVSIYSAADIEQSGALTLADFLRGRGANTLGSDSESSGFTTNSNAAIDLKGLGRTRTLVLINGKRAIGSPAYGAGASNINTIPTSAVERVEIIQDGASSIYGSDAIAGVVNIVLKSGAQGEVLYETSFSNRKGGESEKLSYTHGEVTEQGSITYGIEKQSRALIFERDRDYTAPWWRDNNNNSIVEIGDETDGWSVFGRTVEVRKTQVPTESGFLEVTGDLALDALSGNISALDQALSACLLETDENNASVWECNSNQASIDDELGDFGVSGIKAVDDCTSFGNNYRDAYEGNVANNDSVCAYAFANISAITASIDKVSLFVNSKRVFNPSMSLSTNAYFLQNDSLGRFAPPAAVWTSFPATHTLNPWQGSEIRQRLLSQDIDEWSVTSQCNHDLNDSVLTCDNATISYSRALVNSVNDTALQASSEYSGLWRWDTVGNRDTLVTDTVLDATFSFDWKINSKYAFNAYTHQSSYIAESRGDYFLSESGLVVNQQEEIDLSSQEGSQNLRATVAVKNRMTHSEWGVGVNIAPSWTFSGGEPRFFVGSEYYRVIYDSKFDGQSEAGLVGGTTGNSAWGRRSVFGVFAESHLPVLQQLELNFSLRHDRYSDVGSASSIKASAKFKAKTGIDLIGSYNTGFKAPNLDDLAASPSYSTKYGTDYFTCFTYAQAIGTELDEINCRSFRRSYQTYFRPNADLNPEKSASINLAALIDFDLVVGAGGKLVASYYSDKITDVIGEVSLEDIFWSDWNRGSLTQGTDGVYIFRGNDLSWDGSSDPCADFTSQDWGSNVQPGAFDGESLTSLYTADYICTTTVNAGTFSSSGITVNYEVDINVAQVGDITLGFERNQLLSYEIESYINGPSQDHIGFPLISQFRQEMTFSFVRNRLTVFGSYKTIGGFAWETTVADSTLGTLKPSSQRTKDWSTLDLSASYDFGLYGTVKGFISNITDKDPELNNGSYDSEYSNIYHARGRVTTIAYSLDF